jgi:long-chain acyl-CoA synthetase
VYPGRHLATQPDKPAIIMGGTGEQITYRELEDRSNQLARLLYSRGLRPGDTLALLAENHPRYFEIYWAALRSGLYLTAINRHLSPAEASYLVNDSGATAFITSIQMAATVNAMLDAIPACDLRLMMDGVEPGFISYEDAISAQPPTPLEYQPRGDVMLYSSGTTGRPKGIRRTLGSLEITDESLMGISMLERGLFGMSDSSVYLCPAPLYHSAALQWSAGVHEMGATLVIMEKFDAAAFLALIEREHVTHTQVVPTMMVRALKLPEEQRLSYDLTSLQCIVHAAAPCPVEVKRQMIDWVGPILSEFYGATEGVGMTYLNSADWLAHPGSVGRPITGIPHVCDDDGNVLGAGEIGVIYFEQETIPFEYHGDPEKTRNSRHPEHTNWSTIGDIGYLDEDNFLYLTDRRGFTIISGGVNIYPAEIESALVMHPKVADVAVFGLPDPEMGEMVQAVVQLVDGIEPSDALAAELRSYAREHLASYKVPRRVDFRDELPRLATGKLYKRGLRDEYLQRSS